MKADIKRFFSVLVLGIVSLFFTACSPYGGGGWGTVQTAGYGGYRSNEPWYDDGRGYSPWSGRVICPRCHYNPCRCGSSYGTRYGYLNRGYGYGSYYGGRGYRNHDDHRDHHDHNKSSSSNKKKSSEDEKYKLTGRNVGRGHPKDYHTVDWYKGRGYDVKDFTLKDQRGKTYKSGSSSSSSHKKSSSSSKKSSSSSKKSNSSKGKPQKLKGAKNRA